MTKGSRRTYSTILRKNTMELFLETFSKRLSINLEKVCGKERKKETLEALADNTIRIVSPETFLYTSVDKYVDNAFYLYEKCPTAPKFFTLYCADLKLKMEEGNKEIPLREVFLVFADMLSKPSSELDENLFKEYIRIIFYLGVNHNFESPLIFYLIEPSQIKDMENNLNLNLEKYQFVIEYLFKWYNETFENNYIKILYKQSDRRARFPLLVFMYPIFDNVRVKQIEYIKNTLAPHYRIKDLPKALRNIKNLSEDSEELRSILELIHSKGNEEIFDYPSMLYHLQEIAKNDPYRTLKQRASTRPVFCGSIVLKGKVLQYKAKKAFINYDLLKYNFGVPSLGEVVIDCSEFSTLKKYNYYMNVACNLFLAKLHSIEGARRGLDFSENRFKIILDNVKDTSKEFVEFIRDKLKQIESKHNIQVITDIMYDPLSVEGSDKRRYFTVTVISDIHADYNRGYEYDFKFQDNSLILNCGDTAGDAVTALNWNKKYLYKGGLVVAGNHLGYSMAFPEKGRGDLSNSRIHQEYLIHTGMIPNMTRLTLLNNTVKKVEAVIFIGSCLYTDFALYGENHIEESMNYAKNNMNDFRLITVPAEESYERTEDGWKVIKHPELKGQVRLFTPQDQAYYFYKSFNFIKENVEKYKDKTVVVMTHHAPTPYAISSEYIGSPLNPAFASNLNSFIISHPNIRLWTFGHVHNRCDFILGKTRLVCEPFGYANENNADLPSNYGKVISISDIRSSSDWTKILKKEIKEGEIEVYTE